MGEYRFNINALDAVSSSESNFMQQYNTWGSGNHPEWLERWLKTWTRPRRRAQSSLQNRELIFPSKPFGTKQCLPMWQTLLDATSSRMVIKLRVSSVFYVEGLPVVVLWLTVVLDWLTHECRQSGQQMKFHTTGCITLTFNANILYTSLYNLELLRRMFWTISAYALALISSLRASCHMQPRKRAQSSRQSHELITPSKPFGTKQCLPMWQTLLDATSSRMFIKLRICLVF